MEAVKSFNAELSSLYEVKPPISKAKMTAITRGAIKAIKFYKHVVQSVEKFILKCKPEYKVPGLYVIDSIVRQSRHQFGADKDVFAPRFAKNMQQTFVNLFKCPAEDKSKIIRVLNLWQKNQVFAPDVVQPLFDLADPNNPIHKELTTTPLQSNGMNATNAGSIMKGSPALQKTPTKGSQQGIDGSHLGGTSLNLSDPNLIAQFQQLQRLLTRGGDVTKSEGPVHFDRKLLDFDYGDDDDDVNSSPKTGSQSNNDSVANLPNLLTNPEVLRQLQTLQQTMNAANQSNNNNEIDLDKLRKLQEMKQQEDEFDKHLAQTVPNLPFAAECEFKPSNSGYYLPSSADLSQPPPGYKVQQQYDLAQAQTIDNDVQFMAGDNDNGPDVEVINLDHVDSRSPTPPDERFTNSSSNRRRRTRSRERSRDRRDRDRRSRRSRSRSRSRRHRSRSRERNKIKETEKDKERKKRGLPTIKKDNLSVCSTTLWVGHLSKLVHQEDLSNTFGEFGDIVSIDLIPPRGCAFIVMHRRQDAARCLTKLKNHILHGKAITLAWAPGKGVKGKDLKDYWEGDLGVSYIPWNKIKPDIDLELLEDGGMIDEDTMPPWMKAKVANTLASSSNNNNNNTMDLATNYLLSSNDTRSVDTSQPPPPTAAAAAAAAAAAVAGLLQPPPLTALPMVPPFQFNNRLLGMNVPPGILPNIPIGVPPPNLQGALMQNQLVGLGSPFQGPPSLMQQIQQLDKNQSTPDLNDMVNMNQQSFGMIQQSQMNLSTPHDDNMDIEMEDADNGSSKPERQPLLSEQLEASLGYNVNRNDDDNVDIRRDEQRMIERNNRRNSMSRDSRRFRDEDYRDDRNRMRRKDDRRNDRPNRWSDRNDNDDSSMEHIDRREREKNLNDRLQQMANESIFPNHDNNNRQRDTSDGGGGNNMPPSLLDRRIYPPLQGPPMNPDLDELFMGGGPANDYEHGPLPPPPPSQLVDDFPPPPPPMLDRPDFQARMMDGGPIMHPRMHRDDYDPSERFMRGGRRDFRDSRNNNGNRDFYPPSRDNFGPRLMMRGGPGDFPQRPLMMRPLGPHKFHPRGPPMRGPRPNVPWKDRPNFGPRFDHPSDFYNRGGPPGPPGMYDEPSQPPLPPHMRHNRSGSGGRFDDRRRPRSDFHDNSDGGERFHEKRNSRWSSGNSSNSGGGGNNESPKQEDEEEEILNESQNIEEEEEEGEREMNEENDNVSENRGGNTPLHDEPFNRELSVLEDTSVEEIVQEENVSGDALNQNEEIE